MTCGDNRGVVLMVVCGIAKVNNFYIWIFQAALISFLRTNHKALLKTADKRDFFTTCLGHVPDHDYTSHRSLIWWRECFQASGRCGSTYSYEELKERSSYIKRGLNTHNFLEKRAHAHTHVSCTHIAQPGWSGMPCAWSDWLEMAESYSPSGNHMCWGQAAQKRYRCGRGSQTSPEFAHKTLSDRVKFSFWETSCDCCRGTTDNSIYHLLSGSRAFSCSSTCTSDKAASR